MSSVTFSQLSIMCSLKKGQKQRVGTHLTDVTYVLIAEICPRYWGHKCSPEVLGGKVWKKKRMEVKST